jgi:Na/Pi-cotransporter
MNIFLLTFNLLGGLAVFLLGMKMMSDGLQKMAGVKLRKILSAATSNRFAATISGTLATSIIQSSSATTVMVVGFVSAGLLTLQQALGVIFGANIGTTLTAWIVSLFGFKIQISLFALPVIALGFFGQFLPSKWVGVRRIAEAAVGFGLLFLGLGIMKNAIPADFAQHPMVTHWLSVFLPNNIFNLFALIMVGAILTVVLQSSSAVMAMTLTCAAAGIINFEAACALVLGENIGTTMTANLAAIGAPKDSRRAALGHFLFNFFGVIWVCLFFHPFIRFIDWLVPGNPYVTDSSALTSVLPYHISAFHSVFNIINTCLMLPLLKPLAKLTLRILPKDKNEKRDKEGELLYLNPRFNLTPELALLSARKEVDRMLGLVLKQLDKIQYVFKTDNKNLFVRLITDIKKYEAITDKLEYNINSYLTTLMHSNLSRHAIAQVMALFELNSATESMADCGEKIASLLEKILPMKPTVFSDMDFADLERMLKSTKSAVKQARFALSLFPSEGHDLQTIQLLEKALSDEENLDKMRQTLREERTKRLSNEQKIMPISITAYGDLLNGFERIGDYALRLTETSLIWKQSPLHGNIPVSQKVQKN